ncbi:spore germination protein (amino acid permease) [Halobacillus alkaliphilus]|uniref:Spore germination protein (Amino acid permease) n=1 Tax=Halobacillus alkaliphilus TaxID=396056 RepID=A0A1I2JRS3_9BACI|nr:GerAB/ArcD/ProY family transporter [Halobacillus alkaliphilus]SFF57645.1 spore germination protein (amino acid permease) [Halobacillus alkaliphilus]
MNNSSTQIPENLLISSTMVFFLIHSMQVGVGILGFEKYIASEAGYNAWISIIITGAGLHLILWIIYRILEAVDGDIVSVHTFVYGKYIGGGMNFLFSLYYLLLCVTILRTFIEVIQTWIFPQLPVWLFGLIFILLIYYYVEGGFRVITGACVAGVILGLPLLLFKLYPIQYGNVSNVYPIVDHSILELLASAKGSIFGFLGIGLLFVYYPFIKNKNDSKKWAHFGVFYTIITYLVTAIVAFIYYSEEQIHQIIWATISLWKIINVSFIERFEYIGISLWVFVVIPNLCLCLWAASRVTKRIFHIKQRYVLWIYSIILYVAIFFLEDRRAIDRLNNFTSEVGLYFLMYIPVLYLLVVIIKKVRNRHEA